MVLQLRGKPFEFVPALVLSFNKQDRVSQDNCANFIFRTL
jgi:hypothetical protein